jgi:hypothetical protein
MPGRQQTAACAISEPLLTCENVRSLAVTHRSPEPRNGTPGTTPVLLCKQEVVGSSPIASTRFLLVRALRLGRNRCVRNLHSPASFRSRSTVLKQTPVAITARVNTEQ